MKPPIKFIYNAAFMPYPPMNREDIVAVSGFYLDAINLSFSALLLDSHGRINSILAAKKSITTK